MASLTIAELGDLNETTRVEYIENEYTDLIASLTDYPFAKKMANSNRMKKSGGTTFGWKVRVGTGDSYAQIDVTSPDQVELSDDFVGATCPLRKREHKYGFLLEEEDFNSGKERIIDLIKAKEKGCDFDFIKGLDTEAWAFPLAANTRNLRSIPYWVTKNATTGLYGGIPTGYSDVAGLSPTTYDQWNNYSGQYTNVTLDDLISMIRDMADLTAFQPPVAGVSALGDDVDQQYYTNLSVKKAFENVADSRNDNLGPDVCKMDGKVMVRGAVINYVPALNADTTNPWYQLNWSTFKLVYMWWRKHTKVAPHPGKRNMVANYYDYWLNLACWNRRANGVLATGVTYPVSI